ncbi:TatD family hydrolase [Candidatus Nesciobacter abundans]|uniref:TatD family deoxyribonuclease n=1 Tax=Candidatus Nesciobacter abundans TaxID=2601668 RepID=A0A5C0UFG3_9PROT|nr:TatD family hydrolase [Candidatus Nesciobacter abundans]QEK38835.1 TatD family deoxyribonuclease [Candidatus Nesciobacter abundans]
MNGKWTDSHCHLDYEPMFGNVKEKINNMHLNEVGCAMTISTSSNTLDKIYDYTDYNSKIFASVGVHPLDKEVKQIDVIENYLQTWIEKPNVVAIGETGIDYFKDFQNTPKEQKKSFEMHLEFAKKYNKPIVLHMRDAEQDTLDIIKKYPDVVGIAHCFTGTMEFAKKILDLGWYVSFSGIITFKNVSKNILDVAKFIPNERILIETDAPFLAPEPHRGKKNEPAFVRHVGEFLAELRNVDKDFFADITTRNFLDLIQYKDK